MISSHAARAERAHGLEPSPSGGFSPRGPR